MNKKHIAEHMKGKGAYYDKESKQLKGLGAFHRTLRRQNKKHAKSESWFDSGPKQSPFHNLPPGYKEE